MADEEQAIPSVDAGVSDTVAALNRADLEAALRTAQEEAAAATLRASALEKTNAALSSRLRRVLRSQATAADITSPGKRPFTNVWETLAHRLCRSGLSSCRSKKYQRVKTRM